jgi:hypothetical protein
MQLTGELSKVSLANLIQLVRNGELTGKIALSQGTRTAAIFVDRGAIIHVEADTAQGLDALMELFLWVNGSFSFAEEPLGLIKRTINPFLPDQATDRLLREGLAFQEQKKYLDQLRIGGQTILKPTDIAKYAAPPLLELVQPVLERIDGRKTIAEALADAKISRLRYVQAVCACLMEGLAVVVEAPIKADDEKIVLPPWVIARLKQDKPDISQAIVDLVIWVDRVKCWMFQADADFGRIVNKLARSTEPIESDEDFFNQLGQDAGDFQGPFFGESMPGGIVPSAETEAAAENAKATAANAKSAAENAKSAADTTSSVSENDKSPPQPTKPHATPVDQIKSSPKPPSIEF